MEQPAHDRMAYGGKAVYGARLGILMLEARFPRIPGDMGNARTWPFPVLYKIVPGASPERVVTQRAVGLANAFLDAAAELVEQGADGITTNCGFLSLYQAEIARHVGVPVATSSLMQVPFIQSVLPPGKRVGVLTISAKTLTREHLEAAGVAPDTPVVGTDGGREFSRAIIGNEPKLDVAAAEQDILDAGDTLMAQHPEVGAVLLECTNLAPYAHALVSRRPQPARLWAAGEQGARLERAMSGSDKLGETLRVALVTGAASGIGAATCRRIAGPDMRLMLHTGHRRAEVEAVAKACRAKGATCEVILGDLAEPAVPARLIAATTEKFGGLDCLIANAGYADRRRIGEIDAAGFNKSVATNLRSFFDLATAALPWLVMSTSARVVAVSSFVAHEFKLGEQFFFPASAASKRGLEGLAKSLAAQLAGTGATVNVVVPGFIKKDSGTVTALNDDLWKSTVARIPMGRYGNPDDVAAVIQFLIGDDAGYVTGQLIHCDGGLTL